MSSLMGPFTEEILRPDDTQRRHACVLFTASTLRMPCWLTGLCGLALGIWMHHHVTHEAPGYAGSLRAAGRACQSGGSVAVTMSVEKCPCGFILRIGWPAR